MLKARWILPLALALLAGSMACGGGSDAPVVGDGDDTNVGEDAGDTDTNEDADVGEDTADIGTDTADDTSTDPCSVDVSCDGDDCPDAVFVPGCEEPAECELDEDCDDGNFCTEDLCDPELGCIHESATACCTDDQCEIDGACFDNGQANPDGPCEVCLVVVDRLAWTPDDAATCDDGDPCTDGDACFEGTCFGLPRVCDDGDVCTDEACDPTTGECVASNNTAACDDGDLCTSDDVCDDGVCTGGASVTCDDLNGCTTDACDPAVGCVATFDNTLSCDDGDSCTLEDSCVDGVCIPGDVDTCDDENFCTANFCDPIDGCDSIDLAYLCADTNPCTDESCDPAQGCVFPFNTDPCDDGNLCTTVDTCTEGACLGSPVDPNDSNPCTDDTCEPAVGPVNTPNTLPCDDGDMCTVGDTCADGGCVPGTDPLVCDDENFCTDDSCDAATGCVFTNHTRACDDLDACTEVDTCGDGECTGTPVSCDDGRDCTIDTCNSTTGCANTLIVSNSCRPDIIVEFPLRAATIRDSLPSTVVVTGRVESGAGPITEFTINGFDVDLTPTGTDWNYTFSYPYSAVVGANTLLFRAIDDFGTVRERVQSFHWSTTYSLADVASPSSGLIDPGLGIWLDQETIDDGSPPPPTDLAAIFTTVLDGFDLTEFFDSDEALASQAGYDIYLRSLSYAGSSVVLNAIDGGLRVNASLNNITGRLFFDCTGGFFSACTIAGGDSGGGLTINSIDISADILISVNASHTLDVNVVNANTSINNLNISSDNGWTNFLLAIIEPFIIGGVVSDLENELNSQLSTVIGPLLGDALSALAFNLDFDLPRLDGATDGGGSPITIPVSLSSDFSFTDFQDASPGPQGGALGLRARATTPTRGVSPGDPFDSNLGVPHRIGCGSSAQTMVVPRIAPLEIVFPDDTLNSILRAAWWGGLLDFPVDASLLGDVDLEGFGISNLNMDIEALLPPIASDCGAGGDLRLYVGDLLVNATLELFGQPMTLEVYVSFEAPIQLGAVGSELAITVDAIENVELEVNVIEEGLIGSESVIKDLLRTELVPALGGLLGDGEPLASFPLPEIDLSADLGLPPGTVGISIQPLATPPADERQDGNTIVYGRLR